MISNKNNILNNLWNEAILSTFEHKLSAVLIKGNRMVTKPCCNSQRNTIDKSIRLGSLHAEAHAIMCYYGNISSNINNKKMRKLDLFVTRVNKAGETCNARPCFKCLELMKNYKIRKVYYSVSQNETVCENVKDMISIQTSSVHKFLLSNKLNVTTDQHYIKLLQDNFPVDIKRYNLDIFIRYNLSNVLPTYKIIFSGNKKNQTVSIINLNKIIVKANII
jgi:hypothetical protein